MCDDATINIDHFNLVVLKLFETLYRSFPQPLNIDPVQANNIGFDAAPAGLANEDVWNIGMMINDVITWLEEEGILRFESDPNHRQGYYGDMRLT